MVDIRETNELGPVSYLVVEFPGSRMTGEGLPILVDLVDRGVIRKQFETRLTARRMALDYLQAYRSLTEEAEPRIRLVSSTEPDCASTRR